MSSPGRLVLLDSLRALTTLAILLAHTFGPSGVHANATLWPYSARFEFTIALFMMLSAFLIYRPYARRRLEGRPPPSVRIFARNRLVRVVPAYWVALTITALWMTTAGVGVFTARGIPTYYGFAQVYSGDTILGGIPIAWFLCILVTFYVFVPLWAALMARLPARDGAARLRLELWGCAALFVFGIAYRTITDLAWLRSNYLVTYFLPAYFYWLVPGMALAVLSAWYGRRWEGEPDDGPIPGPLRLIQRFPALGLVAALFLFWVVSTRLGLDGPYPEPGNHSQYFAEHTLNLAIAFCIFVPFVVGNARQGVTRRLLANRPLILLSLISYGILLYHIAVIEQLKEWGLDLGSGVVSWVMWPVITLAIAIPLGTLSYLLIERPLTRIRWDEGLPRRSSRGRPRTAAR